MHHPGPPWFVVAGDEIELAPRDPDPSATYTWEMAEVPEGSSVTLGDDPVEHLVPDVPGMYVARLSAPDGEHDLTVRAFPGDLAPGGGHRSGFSGGESEPPGARSGAGQSGGEVYTELEPETGEGGGRPRLRLDPVVEDDEVVVRAEPSTFPGGSETPSDLDVEFLLDDRDDVDRDDVTRRGTELRIPTDALPDRTRVHAVAVGEDGYSVPDAVEFTRSGDSIDATRPYDPPEWAEESVIYEIYVRTFADTEEDEATVFDAIIDRLDYIESLGVDAIWLTPVLENDFAPHGYNITDFLSIADDLGSREDYERFVEEAHDRGLSVLFDLVCNHSARAHPFFEEAVSDMESEYRDWYEWRSETEPETYFDWPYIANFDFDHLDVRRHMLDVVDEWEPLVDGFRCDMAWAVPNNFWRELHDRCKDRDSEFLLLDETIPYIPDFQAGLFDMHFDSLTYHILREIGNGDDAERLLEAIDERAEIGFPDHSAFMLYVENHDETRYLVDCGRGAAEAAAGAVFTLPGSPLIYAGQEFGQQGRRDDLAWEHADEQLQDHFRSLATVRHEQPALSADADLVRIPYEVHEGDPNRVVAYARRTGDEALVVALNFSDTPATVSAPAIEEATDLVSGNASVDEATGGVTVDSITVLPAVVEE